MRVVYTPEPLHSCYHRDPTRYQVGTIVECEHCGTWWVRGQIWFGTHSEASWVKISTFRKFMMKLLEHIKRGK